MSKSEKDKKATSEKAVFLNPLNCKQALGGLLQVKPKLEDRPKKKRRQQEDMTQDKAK